MVHDQSSPKDVSSTELHETVTAQNAEIAEALRARRNATSRQDCKVLPAANHWSLAAAPRG